MSVYVDTSAFLALANAEDEQHETAVRLWRELVDNQEQIVTCNYVVVEASALIQSRHGIPALRRFAEDMLSVVTVHWVDPPTHFSAMAAVLAAAGKRSANLVDCAGFEIIRERKVDRVLAYDRHFEGRGFELTGR